MKRHALTIMQSITPIFLSFLLFVDEQHPRTHAHDCVRFSWLNWKTQLKSSSTDPPLLAWSDRRRALFLPHHGPPPTPPTPAHPLFQNNERGSRVETPRVGEAGGPKSMPHVSQEELRVSLSYRQDKGGGRVQSPAETHSPCTIKKEKDLIPLSRTFHPPHTPTALTTHGSI